MHPLAGVIVKLRRADEHLIILYHEVAKYLQGSPIALESTHDANGDGLFILRVRSEPPLRFAALVGDILHNIRAALDYFAHELIIANGCSTSRRTQFPIACTQKEFDKQAIADDKLAGIALRGYRFIDAFQPHQMRAPYSYAQHPLWHLHNLSNLDKHRALQLCALGASCRWRFIDRHDLTTREDVRDEVMYDGAVVGRMPKALIDQKFRIEGSVSGQVSFRDEPVRDREVLGVLQSLREFVGEFIINGAVELRIFAPLPDDLILHSHGVPDAMRIELPKDRFRRID